MPGHVRGDILEDSGSGTHGARDTCKAKRNSTSWRNLAPEPPRPGAHAGGHDGAHPEGIWLRSTRFGPISDQIWITVGPMLGQLRTNVGPILSNVLPNVGPTEGPSLDQFGAKPVPILGQFRINLGPILDQH